MKLLLSTHNEHKRREFARLLPGHEVICLPDDFDLPPEEGETFEANALGKARAAAALARTAGACAIADDSGIEAQALGGAPGVRSARFAGERATDRQNLEKLLAEAPVGSPLRYVCALVLVDPERGLEEVFHGYCTGHLAASPGGERGFGYDPAFVPDEQPGKDSERVGTVAETMTMAQLTDEQKDQISHRGRAVRALQQWLAQRAGG
ncbi:MAG TPA: non-canonical purine NTP pyrophosphatase [Solirubrobacteraceae bacterium]|nr:non-canonical purine NTP pyrophosphatase [Solirubrobacteraceae bacterium]